LGGRFFFLLRNGGEEKGISFGHGEKVPSFSWNVGFVEKIPPCGRTCPDRSMRASGMTVRWVLIGWGQAAAPPVPNPLSQKREAVIPTIGRNLINNGRYCHRFVGRNPFHKGH